MGDYSNGLKKRLDNIAMHFKEHIDFLNLPLKTREDISTDDDGVDVTDLPEDTWDASESTYSQDSDLAKHALDQAYQKGYMPRTAISMICDENDICRDSKTGEVISDVSMNDLLADMNEPFAGFSNMPYFPDGDPFTNAEANVINDGLKRSMVKALIANPVLTDQMEKIITDALIREIKRQTEGSYQLETFLMRGELDDIEAHIVDLPLFQQTACLALLKGFRGDLFFKLQFYPRLTDAFTHLEEISAELRRSFASDSDLPNEMEYALVLHYYLRSRHEGDWLNQMTAQSHGIVEIKGVYGPSDNPAVLLHFNRDRINHKLCDILNVTIG